MQATDMSSQLPNVGGPLKSAQMVFSPTGTLSGGRDRYRGYTKRPTVFSCSGVVSP